MRNITKTIIAITLLLSASALAMTCAPNDTECKANPSQLQPMEEPGMKPTEITKDPGITASELDKKYRKQTSEPQPFKVPSPGFYQPKKAADYSNQDQNSSAQQPTPTQPKKSNTPLNIFAPTTDVTAIVNDQIQQTQDKKAQEPDFVFQPPQMPTPPTTLLPRTITPQPTTPQSTTIQYR